MKQAEITEQAGYEIFQLYICMQVQHLIIIILEHPLVNGKGLENSKFQEEVSAVPVLKGWYPQS